MPRLEGEKQSGLPYIVVIALVAAVAAGAYFYVQSSRSNEVTNPPMPMARKNPTVNNSGNAGVDAAAAGHSVTNNTTDSSSATGNSVMDGSTTDSSATGNNASGSATTENMTTNSVSGSSPSTTVTGNAASPSAPGTSAKNNGNS